MVPLAGRPAKRAVLSEAADVIARLGDLIDYTPPPAQTASTVAKKMVRLI